MEESMRKNNIRGGETAKKERNRGRFEHSKFELIFERGENEM
jgi:hypothetical protein